MATALIGFAGCTFFGGTSFREYYVTKSGSDKTGNGSQARPWLTIQHALNNANYSGKSVRVNVGPGDYPEKLTVSDPVFIMGAGRGTTTLQSSSSGGFVVTVRPGNRLRLQAMTVNPQGPAYAYGSQGVSVDGAGVELNDISFFKPGSPHCIVAKNGSALVIGNTKIDSRGLPNDVAVDIVDSTATIKGLTTLGLYDHVINIDDSTVTIENSDLEASTVDFADGIRIFDSNVTIRNTMIHRPPGADFPEDDARSLYEPPIAGVQTVLGPGSTSEVVIEDSDISGFYSGIGMNNQGGEVRVAHTDLRGNHYAGVWSIWHSYFSGSPQVDFGGGALRSPGGNTFGTGATRAFVHEGAYDIYARSNTWNVPAGQIDDRILDSADSFSQGKVIW